MQFHHPVPCDSRRRAAVAHVFARPGYTCNDLWRYSYYEYRDCVYYHCYYGRYW